MGAVRHPERRNADKDLAELVRIFENMPKQDFDSFLKIFTNYRAKSSTTRIVRLFGDALAIGKIRRLATFADSILPSARTGADSVANH